ncbi:MAG: tetratricopeptide repeat protein [Thermoguttaceae bacterium]|nr:tetratricopeptide repeat protein [Thermoguttaceae bacterium]
MAAKRLNIRFVIIFFAILVIGGTCALAAYHIQKGRHVAKSYDVGMKAFEEGNMEEARANLGHVVEKLGNEEKQTDVVLKLALAYADLLDQPNKSHQDLVNCQRAIGRALDLDPGTLAAHALPLKEAKAKCSILLGAPTAAAQTYIELAKEFPNEPKYLLEAAKCYMRNKDSKAADTLSLLVTRHVNFIPGWIEYARYFQDSGQPDLALQHLNSMVASNEDSAQAFAQRAIFLYMHPEMDGMALAEESAINALRLDQNNIDALLAGAKMFIYTKRYDRAHECLNKARELSKQLVDVPQNPYLVDFGIQLADAEGKPETALDILQGDVADDPQNLSKRMKLFERLLKSGKMAEAKKEIEKLREIKKLPPPIIGFFEATIEISEEKWESAKNKLELARPTIAAFQQPQLNVYVDRQLALCYGKLGQIDKQFEAFDNAIKQAGEGEIIPLYVAYIHALHTASRIPLMEEKLYELLDKIGKEKFMKFHELRTLYFALLQQKEAAKPKEEQNWDKINQEMAQYDMDQNNPEGLLLTIRMMVKQNKFDEAKALLRDAIEKHPDTITFVSYLALIEAQQKNFGESLRILDDAIAKGKSVPGLLITKVRIISQMKPKTQAAKDVVAERLRSIETFTDKMQETPRILLLKQLATAWIQIEELNEADRIYNILAEAEPHNIGLKIQIFDLARKSDDERKMNDQMKRIEQEIGESAPESRYCQATKLVWEYSKKTKSPEKLRLAKELLTKAQQQRTGWVFIPRAQAEIAILEKNFDAAINYLYRVDQLGTLTTQQLNLLIRLLYVQKRDQEVRQLIDRKREANLAADAAMMSVEALANSGEGDEAVRRGSEIIDESNPKDLLWIGHIALRAKDLHKAESAFQKVTEIAPENPNGWLSLLQVQRIQGVDVSKEEFIANVTKHVPAEKLPLCLAKTHQLFGDAIKADEAFKEAIAQAPDDLEVLLSISQFYMQTTQPELAIPHLQKMSEIIAKDTTLDLEKKDQRMAWTRRSLAQVYSGIPNFDFQNLGLQLVEENLTLQPESIEDMRVKAMLLAARNNPEDNSRAIEIMENIPSHSARDIFLLAKLYFMQSFDPDASTMKEKYQSIMADLIASNETNVNYLSTFIDMLLEQNADLTLIGNFAGRLESIAGENNLLTILQNTRTLMRLGKKTEAEAYFREHFPSSIEAKDIPLVRRCAIELEKEGLPAVANDIWVQLTAKEPAFIEEFMLFISRQQGFTNAFAYLQANQEKIDPKRRLNMIYMACRHAKQTVSRDEYKQVDEYVKVLFRDDPQILEVQLFEARILELQGKYDEAIAIYNSLLDKPFEEAQIAWIENSLAILLSLTGKDQDRAVALIDEVIKKYPKDPLLLDARAVVYMRSNVRKKTDTAMEDLKFTLIVRNNAVSQFHIAVMYWKHGNANAAKIAFAAAKRMDPFLFQNISPLEVPDFTELTNNLE